jgi:nicotinamide mononucleotide transporter
VDIFYVGMYIYMGLYPTAGLYTVFLYLAAIGYLAWRRSMSEAHPAVDR